MEEGLEQAQVIAVRPGGGPPVGLSWSPDGNNLAYSLLEGDQSRIFLTGGGQAVDLSPGKNPVWSPDGNWLVVERGGPDKTLWLLDRKSGKSYPLGSGKLLDKTNYMVEIFCPDLSQWEQMAGSGQKVSGSDVLKYISGQGKIEVKLTSPVEKPGAEGALGYSGGGGDW